MGWVSNGLTQGNSACILSDNVCKTLEDVYSICNSNCYSNRYFMFEFDSLAEMMDWFTNKFE